MGGRVSQGVKGKDRRGISSPVIGQSRASHPRDRSHSVQTGLGAQLLQLRQTATRLTCKKGKWNGAEFGTLPKKQYLKLPEGKKGQIVEPQRTRSELGHRLGALRNRVLAELACIHRWWWGREAERRDEHAVWASLKAGQPMRRRRTLNAALGNQPNNSAIHALPFRAGTSDSRLLSTTALLSCRQHRRARRTGQDQAHGGLDLAGGDGGLLVVARQVAGFHRDLVKDILQGRESGQWGDEQDGLMGGQVAACPCRALPVCALHPPHQPRWELPTGSATLSGCFPRAPLYCWQLWEREVG